MGCGAGKKIAETVVTEIGERAGLAEFVIYRQQKGQLAEMLWSGSMRICEASGGRDRLWR